MKKYLWIFFILILIGVIAVFVFSKNNNSNQQDSYNAEKMSVENVNNGGGKEEKNNIENSNNKIQIDNNEKTTVSEFSTRLPNDTQSRYDNIKLACKTINGAVVKKDETFSFWKVLGATTEEKGYQKAKTFKSNGEVTESYGGGVCQISTTIYNAALQVKGIEVTERHEHSRDVVYIEDGKDAAVSYGSADLKFKNNLEYDIKIEAKVEENKVKIKLIRI